MIVDCHTHIDFKAHEPDWAGYLAASKMVDASVILAGPETDRGAANEAMARFVRANSDKALGFGVVDPVQDEIEGSFFTSWTGQLGLQGAVLYCAAGGFHPTHSRAMRFYEAAEQAGLPVFFHNSALDVSRDGILAFVQPYLLDEVARAFPRLKIIVGSMGIPFVEQTLALLVRHENVYADLTVRPGNVWQTYNIVVSSHEQGVMDKLVFGSGYPVATAEACIETLLGFNNLMADTNLPTVPRGSLRSVVERNSLELLGIDYSRIKCKDRRLQVHSQEKTDK